MGPRPTTRLVFLSTLALFFILYFVFLQPNGPASPATRAPGHLMDAKSAGLVGVDEDVLKGQVIMPKLGNETAKLVSIILSLQLFNC